LDRLIERLFAMHNPLLTTKKSIVNGGFKLKPYFITSNMTKAEEQPRLSKSLLEMPVDKKGNYLQGEVREHAFR